MSNSISLFRSSLGGYNKNDVNEYFASVSREARTKDEQNRTALARAKKETEAAKEENRILAQKLDELAFELYSEQEKLKQADAEAVEMKNSLAGFAARIVELESEAEKAKSDVLTDAHDKAVGDAETEIEALREKYKAAANEYYEEVLMFVSDIREYLESFVRDIGIKSAELENKIDFMRISNEPRIPEIKGEYTEKTTEDSKEKKENPSEPKKPDEKKPSQKKPASLDEKIEHFIKSTVAAINAFKGK
ncbi:MAG: hypothetical protein KBS59_07245 [Clostridiales bacterium]|nr:hypothetical protein [Clostridiales bacterium]